MTALLYARVSTEDQAEKYGLSSQVHALHVLAAARGYERVPGGAYLDDGYSGASLDRPALDHLRAAARDKVRRAAGDASVRLRETDSGIVTAGSVSRPELPHFGPGWWPE